MKWFNNFLAKVVPILPKWSISPIAMKYVAGVTVEDAVDLIKKLNKEDILCTADVLGEHVKTWKKVEEPLTMYLELIDEIDKGKLKSGISIKLSQMGIEIDKEKAWEKFEKVLKKVKEKNIFLRIDMEDSSLTDDTLEFYRRARKIYDRVGIVLQAYLRRTLDDIEKLNEENLLDVRICKGIYNEPADVAYKDFDKVRENFLKCIESILEKKGIAAIATHDMYLIEETKKYIDKNKISNDRYEYQALYGVPIKKTFKKLISENRKARYYIPFGEEWYAYSIRRLKENPDIAGYIFKDFFRFKQK